MASRLGKQGDKGTTPRSPTVITRRNASSRSSCLIGFGTKSAAPPLMARTTVGTSALLMKMSGMRVPDLSISA
jgi:hypothetical protein